MLDTEAKCLMSMSNAQWQSENISKHNLGWTFSHSRWRKNIHVIRRVMTHPSTAKWSHEKMSTQANANFCEKIVKIYWLFISSVSSRFSSFCRRHCQHKYEIYCLRQTICKNFRWVCVVSASCECLNGFKCFCVVIVICCRGEWEPRTDCNKNLLKSQKSRLYLIFHVDSLELFRIIKRAKWK